jgi:O-antigen ligase
LLAASLAVAVLLLGGVDPVQWEWVAVGISLACVLALTVRSRRSGDPMPMELGMLAALLLWMLLQMVPLPPAVVMVLSPARWENAQAARAFLGLPAGAWLPLSVAPAATFERLLYVIPVMAAFVAAREMGRWWIGRKLWIVATPVIAVALIESLMGLMQLTSAQAASGAAQTVSGTYVNRNHFAGLLELSLPLVAMWTVFLWERRRSKRDFPATGVALQTSILLGVATCVLAGVIASLSRGGFLSTLAALGTVSAGSLWIRNRGALGKVPRWQWLAALALPLAIGLLFSTNAMVLRFATTPGHSEITSEGRLQIWKEALHVIGAYKWTGTGIGAFQQGLYPFRAFAPAMTVDFAHNDYLQALAELGLIGGVLAIAFAIRIFSRPLAELLRPESKQWALSLGLIGSFVAIGLHSFVDFNLYIPANAFALAWLAGLAVSPGLREP